MTAGVGLFGTFTDFVASMFVEPDIRREENDFPILTREIRSLREDIRQLEKKVRRAKRKRPARPRRQGPQ